MTRETPHSSWDAPRDPLEEIRVMLERARPEQLQRLLDDIRRARRLRR